MVNISPQYYRIGCVTNLIHPGTRPVRHRVTPEHRRNPHKTSHRHRIENPIYLINGLFSRVPKNVVGMSLQLGMIDGPDALSAWFEISSESESVRSLGGHERIHRTHERGTEGVCVNRPANLPINDPHLPKQPIRVPLWQICGHTPRKSPKFSL